ncbi:MAG TPA: Hint domain-containing protein [Allosphingosinicella sp.]|jgi:hypothetical protein
MTLGLGKSASPDKKHMAALAQIVEAAGRRPHGVLTLDLRDPGHFLHLTRSLIGPDEDKPNFPALTRTLEITRDLHEQEGGPKPFTLFEMDAPPTNVFQAAAKIQYCSVIGDPAQPTVKALAGGVVTLLQKVSNITASMTITDNNTGTATTTNPAVMQTSAYSANVSIEATVTTPVNFTAILNCLIVPIDNGPGQSLVDTCVYTGSSPVQSIAVSNPVSKHPGRNFIKVGLGRTTDQVADLDYSYSFGVAVVGITVGGTLTLAPSFSLAAGTTFPGYLYLFLRDSLVGGGACIALPIGTDMTQYITNNSTSLTLKIPPSALGNAPWDQNQTIDMDFFMEYHVQPQGGGNPIPAQMRMTSIPQSLPAGGTFPDIAPLLPLQFVWGCLPAGTLIRTETGERPIESIATGDKAFDGDGRLVEVTSTWTGWETTPFVRLSDERGGTILLTTQHPVLTDDGMRLASELSAGAYVRTADHGCVKLTRVEHVPSEAKVFNLDLGTLEDMGDAGTTMIANGYIVGDNRAQGAQAREALARKLDNSDPASGPWALDLENNRRRALGLPLIAAAQALA